MSVLGFGDAIGSNIGDGIAALFVIGVFGNLFFGTTILSVPFVWLWITNACYEIY